MVEIHVKVVARRTLLATTLLFSSCLVARAQEPVLPVDARLVVAIRYLQISGTSHAHLFLYSGAGRLLRQLTNDSDEQVADPVFSSDGKSVIFRRNSEAGSQFYSIDPDGDRARRLQTIPEWYFIALKARPKEFTFPLSAPLPNRADESGDKDSVTISDLSYPAPDGASEILVKVSKQTNEAGDRFQKEPWLRQKDYPDTLVSDLPFKSFTASGSKEESAMRTAAAADEQPTGEMKTIGTLDGVMVCEGSPYLWNPPLRAAIVRQHRGSTDGEGYFALDLNTRTLHEIAPNGAGIMALDDLHGFFCVTWERYLPLGDGKRTVNCSFLDLWSAQLQRTRFCLPKVAGFYGGSLYSPTAVTDKVTFLPGEAGSR